MANEIQIKTTKTQQRNCRNQHPNIKLSKIESENYAAARGWPADGAAARDGQRTGSGAGFWLGVQSIGRERGRSGEKKRELFSLV